MHDTARHPHQPFSLSNKKDIGVERLGRGGESKQSSYKGVDFTLIPHILDAAATRYGPPQSRRATCAPGIGRKTSRPDRKGRVASCNAWRGRCACFCSHAEMSTTAIEGEIKYDTARWRGATTFYSYCCTKLISLLASSHACTSSHSSWLCKESRTSYSMRDVPLIPFRQTLEMSRDGDPYATLCYWYQISLKLQTESLYFTCKQP